MRPEDYPIQDELSDFARPYAKEVERRSFGISGEDPYNRIYSRMQFFPWLEGIVRYTEGTYKPYYEGNEQTWKDKGIDFKIRLSKDLF